MWIHLDTISHSNPLLCMNSYNAAQWNTAYESNVKIYEKGRGKMHEEWTLFLLQVNVGHNSKSTMFLDLTAYVVYVFCCCRFKEKVLDIIIVVNVSHFGCYNLHSILWKMAFGCDQKPSKVKS